ncbi:hypothetical protein MKX01_018958, partial [Papaver californicum]
MFLYKNMRSIRQKIFQIGSDVYNRCEILNFQCSVHTTFNFLWFYLKAAREDEEMEDRAKYLAVLSLMDPDLLCYWLSTVAAGLSFFQPWHQIRIPPTNSSW